MHNIGIDPSLAFENWMLEQMERVARSKLISTENLSDLLLKIAALVKVIKNRNVTENVRKFCVGQTLMPIRLRSFGRSHTFSLKLTVNCCFHKTHQCPSFSSKFS